MKYKFKRYFFHWSPPRIAINWMRKIKFKRWGKLEGPLEMLYGGIDSQEVTERATDPSGAMGAIQRTGT